MVKGLARWAKWQLRQWLCRHAAAERLSPEQLQQRWRSARHCLLLCGAGIGDAVMATPVIAALRKRRPQLRLTVIARRGVAEIPRAFAGVEVLSYGERWHEWLGFARLLRRCWSLRADAFLALQPANTLRHGLIAAASRAPLRLKHAAPPGTESHRDLSCLYHGVLPLQPERHRVEENLDLLRILGEAIPEGAFPPHYPVSAQLCAALRRELQRHFGERPCVALHLGSGRPEKCWTMEGFAAVAQWLEQHGYGVVLVGGPAERRDAERFAAAYAPSARVYAGRLDLPHTAALLHCCHAAVTNDSGIMHLAAAVGTPVVAIFQASDPCKIGPYAANALVVGTAGAPPSVEMVLQALARQLTGPSHSDRCSDE